MKLENLPDYAKQYKKPGCDVRKKGDSFQLFNISSHRVKGKSYPVLNQEYVGTILPDGSLKRKASPHPNGITYQEFGLSDFIYKKYSRKLQRSIFNSSAEFTRSIILLAILSYVLDSVSDTAISLCRLTAQEAPNLKSLRDTKQKAIDRLAHKIKEEQDKFLGADREEFELLMKLCVVDSISVVNPEYPAKAVAILSEHGEEL